MVKIILASQSPRRKQLLEWAEVPFQVVVKETDETFPPGLKPGASAIYIARKKAIAVQAEINSNTIILAADTIVVLNERIIGKPKDREEAIDILSDLSGQKHVVITGVVIKKGEKEISRHESRQIFIDYLSSFEFFFKETSWRNHHHHLFSPLF